MENKLNLTAVCGLMVALVMSGCSSSKTDTATQPDARTAGVVARQDYEVGENWRLKKTMGKDFWHILGVSQDSQPDSGNWAGNRLKELADKPLFKESGLHYGCVADMTSPGSGKVSIAALEPSAYLSLVETRPDAPFFISFMASRPLWKLMKNWEFDQASYEAWKNARPNFTGFVQGEWCNDFQCGAPWTGYWWEGFKKNCKDKELIVTIEREFAAIPKTKQGYVAALRKCYDFCRRYYFDDPAKMDFMQEAHCYEYALEWGSGIGWIETTNTGWGNCRPTETYINYRHRVSLFFTRGANRQYGKSWAWYVALFYNGYDDNGNYKTNSFPDYLSGKKSMVDKGDSGPGYGMSCSLYMRDLYLAYLSGAGFVESEGWHSTNCQAKNGDGKLWELSPLGKVWEDWFEFTRRNPDRGVPYTPVALLVPFAQGYPMYGGRPWGTLKYERPDWMVDAFMFTIAPYSPVTKDGDEGALSNSPHGDIYDVVAPDTPGQPVSLAVLDSYKVAALLGDYPWNEALAGRLMEYVENGGTLLINVKQLGKHFPISFAGVERTNSDKPVGNMVSSQLDGGKFTLTEPYDCEAVNLKGARPLMTDSAGNVLACSNAYGKGRVIVATVDCMVPKNGDDKNVYFMDSMVYRKKFPFVEHFLKAFTRETLPLEVKGDIEYGLNKLSDGWLLYLINNKGVTKFTNKAQTLDLSKTAKVEVSLKDIKVSRISELRERIEIPLDAIGNSFAVEVPPGGVRVIKLHN